MRSAPRRATAGFSLVEAAMSIFLVAVMLAAVMTAVGAGRMVHYKNDGQRRGAMLAQQLLAEILRQDYDDPDGPSGAIGPEAGETGLDRSLFDDVDDYDAWFAQPPQDRDGSTEPDQSEWSREVSVAWVDPSDLMTAFPVETKAKRVIVTVKHKGLVMAEFTAVRTGALPHVDR